MATIIRTLAVFMTVSALFAPGTPATAQTLYRITDLGALPEAPAAAPSASTIWARWWARARVRDPSIRRRFSGRTAS